jgi:hypothetical protein
MGLLPPPSGDDEPPSSPIWRRRASFLPHPTVAVAQIEVIPERQLQQDLVCVCVGGGASTAPVAFLPPHPMAQIKARVGGAVIFFMEWTPFVGQHRPMKAVKVSSAPMKNVLFLSENFRRSEADGS